MELIKIIHNVSIAILWVCIATNLWCVWRLIRARKELEVQTELVKAWILHKKEQGEWKCIEVEVSDERNNDDNG